MGVDFLMEAVKIGPGGEVIFPDADEMDDKSYFTQRHHILEVIFGNGIFGKRIKSLMADKNPFSWFDNAILDDDKKKYSRDDCLDPNLMLDSLTTLYRVLKDHENEFPVHYWLNERKEMPHASGSMTVFIGEELFHIQCDWNRCEAISGKAGKNRIDLRGNAQLECYEAVKSLSPGLRYEKGEKMPIYILTRSVFGEYMIELDQMLGVCNYAISNGLMIFTSIG